MVNQNVWIAITIVLFVAGIGVGFGIFSSSQVMVSPMMGGSMNSFTNNPQAMQQMMQDPAFRNEMMEFMIQDTEHMNQWMLEDPQHNTMMIEEMKQNHDFMVGIAIPMIHDPGLILYWSIADKQYSEFQMDSKQIQPYVSGCPGPKDTPPIQAVI